MEYKPDKYSQVPLNSYLQTNCSPQEQLPHWRGIMITAPDTVIAEIGETLAIPICGYYQLNVSRMQKTPLRLIVRHVESDKVFTGAVVDEDPSPDEPPPVDSKAAKPDLSNVAVGSYFNPDLMRYVKMPGAMGTYEVYAEYGGIMSNKLLIKVEFR